jgi:hypothetical protein
VNIEVANRRKKSEIVGKHVVTPTVVPKTEIEGAIFGESQER